MAQKIILTRVFIKTSHQISYGTDELVLARHGCVEQQIYFFAFTFSFFLLQSPPNVIRHSFEHLKNQTIRNSTFFRKNVSIGQVKQIVRSQTKMHNRDIFWLKSVFQHSFEICVSFNFGIKYRQRPPKDFRFNCLHHQVCPFYQTHLYRTSTVFDTLLGPLD